MREQSNDDLEEMHPPHLPTNLLPQFHNVREYLSVMLMAELCISCPLHYTYFTTTSRDYTIHDFSLDMSYYNF